MEGSFEITLQIVIAVLAGISAQVVAEYIKVPSIVFLLLFGILLGEDSLNILHPHELGIGLEVLVALSVAIILFEGGLNLELRELGKEILQKIDKRNIKDRSSKSCRRGF